MTIGKKAALSFGAILLVNFVLGYDSLTVVHSLGSELDKAVNSTGKAVEQIGRLTTALSDMKASEAGFILFSSLNDADQTQAAQRSFVDAASRMESAIREVRPALSPGPALDALESVRRGQSALSAHFQEMIQLCAAQKCNEALTMHTQKALPLIEQLNRSARDLTETQRGRLAQAAAGAASKSASSYTVSIGLIALSIAIAIAVFFVLQQMNTVIRKFAARLAGTAEQMSGAASEVSASSAQLANAAFKQASAIEETSATTEELASMTRRNAESTRSAFQLVIEGENRVTEANKRLKQMEASMREISASSDKISKIIKVIEEIAFQTNILALNAAVEAARAGEAGLGFGVVAEEVRNLAQRCSQAAKDTASLIEESIIRAGEGSANTQDVAQAIVGITEDSKKIRALVDEVNMASQEQAKGIEHVSQAVNQMSQATQQSANNAGKGASAGKQMASQSEVMNSMVLELRELVGAG